VGVEGREFSGVPIMTEVMQADKSSRENIAMFLETIDDEDLKVLLKGQIDNILAVGANTSDQSSRQEFFDAVQELINQKMGESSED